MVVNSNVKYRQLIFHKSLYFCVSATHCEYLPTLNCSELALLQGHKQGLLKRKEPRLLTMHRQIASLIHYWIISMMIFIAALTPFQNGQAQARLDRLSTVERSDGLGYVTRFHFSSPVDSFKMVQSSDSLIQILFYAPNIYGSAVDVVENQGPTHRIETFSIPIGLGADLHLNAEQSYFAKIYFDRNGNDVLVSQERMEQEDLLLLTEGIPTIPWSVYREAARASQQESESDLEGNGSLGSASGRGPAPEDGLGAYGGVLDNLKFDVVVIDAGHGGDDPGSIGPRGIREKDVTLKVAKKLGAYIEEYLPDVEVVYTRDRDIYVDLEERGSIGNRARGDLFVSIHTNSFKNKEARGTEVYFLGLARSESALEVMKRENSVVRFEGPGAKAELSEEDLLIYELANSGYISISQQIAGMIDYQFTNRAQRASRGVKQAGFMVLYHASMPALLVELGFISNEQEARFLNSEYGQDILASAIFRAIRDYKLDVEKKLHTQVR